MKKKGERLKDILLDKEKVKDTYQVGNHTFLLTNNRVVIKKTFPRKLIAFKFKDVEAVEYMRKFNLLNLIIAFICSGFAYVFYYKVAAAKHSLFAILFNALGFTYVVKMVSLVFVILAVYYIGLFLLELYGTLQILLEYHDKPIVIHAQYSDTIFEIVKKIENQKKK